MAIDWLGDVDIYCERLGPEFWAEPVNALSNLAFPIAALWAGREARRRQESWVLVWTLIVIGALIGIGSFLFHTFANGWSELADTVPIWGFVALYIYAIIWRIKGRRPGLVTTVLLVAAPVAVVLLLATGEGAGDGPYHPGPLNGSEQYAPALIALLVCALLMARSRHPQRHWMQAATVIFLFSLGFRTFDHHLCAAVPSGLHFMWHILNGLLIGVLLQMIIRIQPPQPAIAPTR